MSPRPVDLPESEFASALRLVREGRCAEALRAVERSLAGRVDREACAAEAATALAEIARQAVVANDLDTSERALEIALDLKPNYADLHFQFAGVLLLRQRRVQARRSLDNALRLNPKFLAARLERALLDAREGRLGEALDSLRAAAQELPVDDPRAFQQGLKSLERADWDEADSLFKRALNLSDPVLQSELERFHRFLEQGEPGRAAQVLREVLPKREGYPDLHYLLGIAELQLGQFDDALVSLARALELNPNFHEARVQFANALESVGQSAQAEEQVALVLRHQPAHRRARELQSRWAERARRRTEPGGRAARAAASAPEES